MYDNFGLHLHDNIEISVNLQNSSGNNRMSVSDDGVTFSFAANITVVCSSYYIKSIAMKDHNGTAITVYDTSLPPQDQTNFSFDLDVDLDKLGASGAPTNVTEYHVRTANSSTTIKTITITYGTEPRSYNISYTNAVNGTNGVTNNNKTSYNVTTANFNITAPSRTGYDFDGFTYTDAAHTTATAASQPMTISRGDAATRNAITFTASLTAHTYTLRLHHNDGTDDYTDMAMTYGVAAKIQSVSRTGYHITSWTTNADGSGTSYTNGQSVSNLTPTNGAIVDLYAQWAINTYTVVFYKYNNQATGTMTDQSFTYGESKALTKNAYALEGYIFNGWNTRANGSGTAYTDEQVVSNLTEENAVKVLLYAQWSLWPGQGTSSNPYIIQTVADFVRLATQTAGGETFKDTYFRLDDDLDLNGVSFGGIGSTDVNNGGVRGTFDGNGYTISNVTINRSGEKKVGLFSYLWNGTVKNLILDGATITGQNLVGALVGDTSGTPTIENCLVKNAHVTASGTQSGIIVGYRTINLTLTANYYADCQLTVGSDTRTSRIGTGVNDGQDMSDAELAYLLFDDDSSQPSGSKKADRIAAIAGTTNVILDGRTLYKDGYWNTLCLPFDVTIANSPLAGATVKKLTASSSNLTDGTLTLNFEDETTTMTAGTPYIIKWASGSNITNPVFTGVTVSTADNDVPFTGGSFIGTYEKRTFDADNKNILLLGVKDDKSALYYPQAGAHIGTFRAYFDLTTGGSGGGDVHSFNLNFGEETTGIVEMKSDGVKREKWAGAWYTLDGRKLKGKPTASGIYINNGKKVLVRDKR